MSHKYPGYTAIVFFFMASIGVFPSPLSAELVDRIVAIVNQDIITESEVDRLLAEHIRELRLLSTQEKTLRLHELRGEAIHKLIEQKLLSGKIKAAKIEVTDQELSDAINRILADNHMSLDEFKKELTANDVSFSEFKDNLTEQIKQSKFLQMEIRPKVQISDADLLEYYNRHLENFQTFKEIKFLQLIVSIDTERPLAKAIDLARTLKHEAETKRLPLSELKSYATHLQFEQSQWMGSQDLNPELLRILQGLKPREISAPLAGPSGALLLQVEEWRGAYRRSFHEVKTELQETLYSQKLDGALSHYLGALRQQAYIQLLN